MDEKTIPPRTRVRVRPQDAPQEAPKPRQRVRHQTEAEAPIVAPDVAAKIDYRRHYTSQEAIDMAGKAIDPVALGLYSNTGIITVSTFSSGGPGDNTVGKYWRMGDDTYLVWVIKLDGTLAFAGRMTGTHNTVFDRLMAMGRGTALTRSRQTNPPVDYEHWRGPCKRRKAAA